MTSKNQYLDFILLITIALGLITGYSFVDVPFSVELKRSDAASYLRRDTLVTDTLALDTMSQNTSPIVDSTAQSILLIGDSMLEGLSPRLLEYATSNGHTLNSVVWYSSTTKYFGQSDTLKYFINKYKPTLVLISLGANELFVKDIRRERAAFVKHIVSTLDTIPYVWIGPPNWKPDTGINDMIVASVGKRRYYPSLRLKYERSKDGAHPTRKSSALWVDSLSKWIADSSAHRIVLERPADDFKVKGNGIRTILQPLK